MEATKTVRHETYTGASDADGYTTAPTYSPPVVRLVYGWQPETLDTTVNADYAKRVTDRIEVLVPSVADYKPLDRIELPPFSAGNLYLVDQIRDYSTGPFGSKFGGVVVVEKVSG